MVKILYLIVWETSDKSYCVYVFFDLYLFGFSLEICFPKTITFVCTRSTIFLPMVTLRQPLKNKNLFSLTLNILGSYMIFTVFARKKFSFPKEEKRFVLVDHNGRPDLWWKPAISIPSRSIYFTLTIRIRVAQNSFLVGVTNYHAN